MASPSLTGKTALITGASKGIGNAVALALAKQGANIVVNYSSDDAPANELVKAITSTSGPSNPPRAVAIKADAGDVTELEKMVDEVIKIYGKIDILIPNAAIMPMADLEHITEAMYEKAMRLNVKGPLFLAQKSAPHMPSGSHIIFVSTTLTVASTVTAAYLLYCTSKGAIEQAVRVLSKDLARRGISVNAVAPGPTGTDLFYQGKSEQLVGMIASANPHNRVGTPQEVADALVWLAGDGSRWVTGQVVRVNGGMA